MTADDIQLAIYEGGQATISFRADPENDTLWATHVQVAELFGCTEANVIQHLQNLYAEEEIDKESTTKKFLVVQMEGNREVRREVKHVNLDAILSVGQRVNSKQGVEFRKWAIRTLSHLVTHGFAVDAERLAESPTAQRQLASYLRNLRLEEKSMYAVVRDVFKSSASDYDKDSQAAHSFFAMAQDKFHYAVMGQTAAQIVLSRADARKDNMGLATYKGQVPTTADVTVGKNYLTEDELRVLENISEQFLLFAESKAMRGHKMTMEELAFRLNTLLTANDYPVLYEYQSYQRKDADLHAKKELASYQKRLRAASRTPLDQGSSR